MKVIFIILLSFIIISCADYKVEVNSDTKWSGYFGSRTVAGEGNKIIDIPDKDNICVTAIKLTEFGYIQLHMYDAGFWGFLDEYAETEAPFGLVTVCN